MSFLIKGMRLPPKGEYNATIYVCHDGEVYIAFDSAEMDEYADYDGKCDLIEVPPHGRLIDADAFIKEKQEWYCKQNCGRRKGIKNGKECFIYKIGEAPCRACEIDDLISAVDDAPTIIAEDGT